MTQFVEVKAPVTGEKGKVPARSLRRWLDKGFEAVNAEEAEQVLADYPDPNAPAAETAPADVQPVPPSEEGDAAETKALIGTTRSGEPLDGNGNGVMDIFEQPTDDPTPEPGTAADSADTSTSTSGRRRGGAAAPDAR